jgi:gliding motility-associated-like protein
MSKLFSLSSLAFILSFAAKAQTPTVQDCLGAIPVCQPVYMEDASPVGDGNYNNEINTNISCTSELNSIWYVFTVNQNGSLGFLLTPNNIIDDYDWAVFDITNATCADIRTNPALQVSCNAAGGGICDGLTGATGGSVWSLQGAGCGSSPPNQSFGNTAFNSLIPMQAGRTYVLMVSNWTGSNFGYKIDFGLSTGLGIFDQTEPEISEFTPPPNCGDNLIQVEFNEYIQCNSFLPGSLRLNGPGGPYTLTPFSANCNAGGTYDRNFTFTVNPPIAAAGNYSFEIVDNNLADILDLCGNPAAPAIFPFTTQPVPQNIDVISDTSMLCAGSNIVLDASFPGATAFQWQDGSTAPTLTVNAEGIYRVNFSNACGSGADSVEVVALNDVPVVNLGPDTLLCAGETLLLDASSTLATYRWQDNSTAATYVVGVAQPGTYRAEVTNICGTTIDEVVVNYIPPIQLDWPVQTVLCAGDTLFLDVSHPAASYSWQDGFNGPQRNVLNDGVFSVTVTTQCETRSEEMNVLFIVESLADLGPDTTLCPGEVLEFDLTIPGATYLWQDNTDKSVYTVAQSGNYAVTVTTACNTFNDALNVEILPNLIVELGNDTVICPGKRIVLSAEAGTPADYLWQDGAQTVSYIVDTPGVYSVSVLNQCERVIDQIVIEECEVCTVYAPNAFSPNDDGFNDKFLPLSDCLLDQFTMRIFNRWGALVYETNNPAAGWDGRFKNKNLEPGVYVWQMEYVVVEDGKPRAEKKSGDVAILR